MVKFLVFFLLSLIIVGFGQPAWISSFSFFAAIIGFAFFWISIEPLSKKTHRFFAGVIWFSIVQSIHLSWINSPDYQGNYIFFVYLFLIITIALEFGILTLMIPNKKPLTIMASLSVASLWTIFEWSRLYVVTGFTWSCVGMAYADHYLPLQIASIWGVYGLSFWVIFGNVLAYNALVSRMDYKKWLTVFVVALFPYFYGFFHVTFLENTWKNKKTLSALLVQPCLLPEQRDDIFSNKQALTLLYQWQRIFVFLKKEYTGSVDLIALPEGALPNNASKCCYLLKEVKRIWIDEFGENSLSHLPKLTSPLARMKNGKWFVSNNFIAQALANYFDASLVIGLTDVDPNTDAVINAAFCFERKKPLGKYVKRILVPLGEYIPFEWCNDLAEKFGVYGSFQPGDRPKVLQTKVPLSVSICYEETYSDIIRQSRDLGAELFVNISNDVWFPNSKLPKQHFYHGRIRAVENGVPVLRACNTGLTGGIDCMGRVVKILDSKQIPSEKIAGALSINLPLEQYRTFYSKVGDGCIIGVCSLILVIFFKHFRENRTC